MGDVDKLHSREDRVHREAIEESMQNIQSIIEEFAVVQGASNNP